MTNLHFKSERMLCLWLWLSFLQVGETPPDISNQTKIQNHYSYATGVNLNFFKIHNTKC